MFFQGIFSGSHSVRSSGGFATTASAIGAAALFLSAPIQAQGPDLRCDLQVKSTPGAGADSPCLDLVAMQNGGPAIQTAGNATRISTEGFRLCENAFTVSSPAGADVVFIYDNSGSMLAGYAKINAASGDTTFYYNSNCGNSPLTTGTLTYNTLTGPRTIGILDSTVTCNSFSGDPYNARVQVVTQGIAYLAQLAPLSTAGAIAFTTTIAHTQPPLPLSVPGNADIVKASVVLNTSGGTSYGPPLRQANTWLADTSLTKTGKRAIVFISDGAPTDVSGSSSYLNAVGPVPIYSIFLGDTNSQFTRLRDMSTNTGGQFYRVDPGNIAMMNQVMQNIIQAITVSTMPQSIEIINSAWAPPMVSRSTSLARTSDSSVSVVLDSIVALKLGMNNLTVKVTMPGPLVREYPVAVKADGPVAGTTTQDLVCYQQPGLTLINPQGQVDTAYPSDITQYDVRLTRATSDIGRAVVTAISTDSAKTPATGDSESILLSQSSTTGGTTTNLCENYDFNGSLRSGFAVNNVLEAHPNGFITLTWTHPRDPRETTTYTLPGRKVPVTPGFIDVVRLTDVPKGVPITTPIIDPIVIRGGVTVTKTGDVAVMTHRGILHNPHSITETILDPNHTPTWVFKTASPFSYRVSIFDNLGQFLISQEGAVDSTRWEQMRGNADSLAVAFSVLPVTRTTSLLAFQNTVLKFVPHIRSGSGSPRPRPPGRLNAQGLALLRLVGDRFRQVRHLDPDIPAFDPVSSAAWPDFKALQLVPPASRNSRRSCPRR